MYYFDYAAATPLGNTALAAMQPYLQAQFYNPSALYIAAQDVKKALEKARADVAGVLGAKTSEIIFTAGGTEADNLAVAGVMRKFPEANCIVSAIEHEAILEIAETFDCKIAPVKPDGRVNLDALKDLIDDSTVLVSVMYANNEIGTVQPLSAVSKFIEEIRKARLLAGNTLPLYFHTDASQSPNYLQVLVNTLGVDLMSLNAGKIYGPKETGALYVKTGVQIEPIIRGGGQERGMRSGTQNVANIIGFAAALTEASQLREAEAKRLKALQQKALRMIAELFPDASINGSTEFRLPNNIHLTIPGEDNERLMMGLDEEGFMVATGSACSASNDDPSHVLKAIGLSDDAARSSLRITMGRDTTEESLINFLKTLKNIA